MKNIIRLFIMAAIGVLMVNTTPVFSADDTGSLGASITGSDIHTISLANTSLSYTDPGDMGPQTYTLNGGPVEITIEDNNFDVPGSGGDPGYVGFLGVNISSTYPPSGQYGLNKKYWVYADAPIWTPAADNEYTPITLAPDPYPLTDGVTPVAVRVDTDTPTGTVIHGTVSQDLLLKINSNKRLAGDTSDSITLTYTFYEY